jgi:hypothetical protein
MMPVSPEVDHIRVPGLYKNVQESRSYLKDWLISSLVDRPRFFTPYQSTYVPVFKAHQQCSVCGGGHLRYLRRNFKFPSFVKERFECTLNRYGDPGCLRRKTYSHTQDTLLRTYRLHLQVCSRLLTWVPSFFQQWVVKASIPPFNGS